MFKLTKYSIEGNVLLSPKHRVRVWIKHKRMDLYVQRVESALYERMGWGKWHYLDQQVNKFNKSHPSLMFTDSKGRCVAYVAYHNKTHRGCKNGIMISRIVIAPQFRGRGLSVVILNLVGAMLTASGYVLYFMTELKFFGRKVGESGCWKGTTFDDRFRDAPSDKRNKHRKGGKASHKKYVGKALVGYSDLFLKVDVLRPRVAKIRASKTVVANSRRYVGKSLVVYSDLFLKADVLSSKMSKIEASKAMPCTGVDVISIILETNAASLACSECDCDSMIYVIGYEDSS